MLLTTAAALQPLIKHPLNLLDIQDLKCLRCLANKVMVSVLPLWESNTSSSRQVLDDDQEGIKLTCESGQEAGIWKGHCFSLSIALRKINVWEWFHKWQMLDTVAKMERSWSVNEAKSYFVSWIVHLVVCVCARTCMHVYAHMCVCLKVCMYVCMWRWEDKFRGWNLPSTPRHGLFVVGATYSKLARILHFSASHLAWGALEF